jgi:hypothetical protein
MVRKTEKLDEIEAATIDHYNQNAEAYWYGTKNHDVTQNYAALFSAVSKR